MDVAGLVTPADRWPWAARLHLCTFGGVVLAHE